MDGDTNILDISYNTSNSSASVPNTSYNHPSGYHEFKQEPGVKNEPGFQPYLQNYAPYHQQPPPQSYRGNYPPGWHQAYPHLQHGYQPPHSYQPYPQAYPPQAGYSTVPPGCPPYQNYAYQQGYPPTPSNFPPQGYFPPPQQSSFPPQQGYAQPSNFPPPAPTNFHPPPPQLSFYESIKREPEQAPSSESNPSNPSNPPNPPRPNPIRTSDSHGSYRNEESSDDEGSETPPTEGGMATLKDLRKNELVRFVMEVHRRPCLWDPDHRDKGKRKVLQEAWDDLARVMSANGRTFTVALLRGKWTNVRTGYQTYRKKLAANPMSSKRNKLIKHRLADHLSFLNDILENFERRPRASQDSNMDEPEDEPYEAYDHLESEALKIEKSEARELEEPKHDEPSHSNSMETSNEPYDDPEPSQNPEEALSDEREHKFDSNNGEPATYKDFTKDDVSRLIVEVCNRPTLWDPEDPDKMNPPTIIQKWEEIVAILSSSANRNFEYDVVRYKWKHIRAGYHGYRQRLNAAKKKGSKKLPTHKLAKELAFLNHVIDKEKGKSSGSQSKNAKTSTSRRKLPEVDIRLTRGKEYYRHSRERMSEDELNAYRAANAARERDRRAKRSPNEKEKVQIYKDMWRKNRIITAKRNFCAAKTSSLVNGEEDRVTHHGTLIPEDKYEVLKEAFEKDPSPSLEVFGKLTEQVNLTIGTIQKWFASQRNKQNDSSGHVYTDKELEVLLEAYQKNPRPEKEVYDELAEQLGHPVHKIQGWFYRKRYREKAHKKLQDPEKDDDNPDESEPSQDIEQAISYNGDQLKVLFDAFSKEPNPDSDAYNELAKKINVPSYKIRGWFNRQRTKAGLPSMVTKISDEVQMSLLKAYQENPYPEAFVYEDLSEETSLTVDQIKRWFSRQRTKDQVSVSDSKKTSILEEAYQENPYPEPHDYEELVTKTGLTLEKVKAFFWRKRNKDRFSKTPKPKTPNESEEATIEKRVTRSNYKPPETPEIVIEIEPLPKIDDLLEPLDESM